jgi:hypothetical protein
LPITPILISRGGKLTVQVANSDIIVESIPRVSRIAPGKWDYMFGKVTSSEHNTRRSLDSLKALNSVGIYDDAAGRSILQQYYASVVKDKTAIVSSKVEPYGVRVITSSVLHGPTGDLIANVVWDVTDDGFRLITPIFKTPKP